MDRRALKLSLFRELDEKFIRFEEVTDVFQWHTTGCLVHTELKLTVPVDVPGSVVSFNFETKFGDIAFGVTFVAQEDKDTESVVDLARIRSDLEIIDGSFEVPRVGVVNFLWDNSFSWLTAKSLAYNVVLQQGVAIVSADKNRITSAKEIVHKIREDDEKSKQRYDEEIQNIEQITDELPVLEQQLSKLQSLVNQKKSELKESKDIASKAIERITINEETKPGLYFRYLSREDLSLVFSFLYDDAGVGLVCRYWLTTIVRDITKCPPSGPCIYSISCLNKPTPKPKPLSDPDTSSLELADVASTAPTAVSVSESEVISAADVNVGGNDDIGDCDSDLGFYTPDVTTRFKKQDMQINDIRHVIAGTATAAQDSFIMMSSTDSNDTEKESALDTLRWRQRRAVLRRQELRREASTIEEALKELKGQIHEQSSEKRKLRDAIIAWKQEFADTNGRRPTDEEKEAGAKPMYLNHNQCDYVLSKLEPQYAKLLESYQAKLLELKRFSVNSEE